MIIRNRQDINFKEEEKNLQTLEKKIDFSLSSIKAEIAENQLKLNKERDPDVIKTLNNENFQYKSYSRFFERCKPNPYYARISFLVNGKEESYVIGKEGINDYQNKSDILVVDWRTDLAQVYNQKSRNEFQIDGESYKVTLRRGVNIKNANLIFINNEYAAKKNITTPITQSTKNTGIESVHQEQVTSDRIIDPFLLELLQDQRRINAVTDIIASIQENQNEIITQPYDRNFIVQGCSGSGKTMILLHRISYLLFNKLQEHINVNNIRIITPNNNFRFFIKDLVHQLDLDNIPVMTIDGLYTELIKRVTSSLETDKTVISDSNLPSDFVMKIYSSEFLQRIDDQYKQYWSEILQEIKKINPEESEKLPPDFTYAGYQNLYNEIGWRSVLIEKYNQEIEQARIKYVNSKSIVRENVFSRTEQLTHEIETTIEDIKIFQTIRKENEEKIAKNLSRRNDMDTYQYYQNYKKDSKKPIAIFLYDKIPDIINRIQNTEKELESVPIYAFLKRNKITSELKKLTEEYQNQVRDIFQQYYERFDKWQEEIEQCNQEITNCQDKTEHLIAEDESLKRLLKLIATSIDIDLLMKDSDFNNWEPYLSPYTVAWNDYKKKITQRNESPEYRSFDQYKQLLEKLRPEKIYQQVYRLQYQDAIKGKNLKNEQFHFELFLKLHFCQRYFDQSHFKLFINIDEGQTLFPAEYKTLRGFLSSESIFNIYGDINQKVDYGMGIDLWEDISDHWKVFVLNENYRNTRQVTDFCNKEFSAGLIPIGIEGPDVQIYTLNDSIEWMKAQYKNNPEERYVIIWNGDLTKKSILTKEIKDFNAYAWDYSDKKAIYILTPDMARGLEFENVLVWDEQMTIGEKYISYTRALNNLIIARNKA